MSSRMMRTPEKPITRGMTEKQLLALIVGELRKLEPAVRWHHCRDGRQCQGTPGIPDLVITGPGGTIFRELKNEYEGTSPDQDRWAKALYRPGTAPERPWALWRPADWASGRVAAELAAVAATGPSMGTCYCGTAACPYALGLPLR